VTERLVIQRWPGGWKFISRARLRPSTPVGEALDAELANVDGLEISTIQRHSVLCRSVHVALWPWDEVEAAVIVAFRAALGVDDLEVIREDKMGGLGELVANH
jgi:hypothetical protein